MSTLFCQQDEELWRLEEKEATNDRNVLVRHAQSESFKNRNFFLYKKGVGF